MLSAIVILSIAIYCITEQCIDEYNNINLFKLVIRVAPATVIHNIPGRWFAGRAHGHTSHHSDAATSRCHIPTQPLTHPPTHSLTWW